MLNQSRGLPIGGCLSAGLVELVALFMEHVKPWPLLLLQMDTARYRDNFFMVPTAAILNDAQLMLATELSAFYEMPVKLEGAGSVRWCLEMRLHCQAGSGIKATLAYRTDADRQGESHDVSSWPLGAIHALGPCSTRCYAGLPQKLQRTMWMVSMVVPLPCVRRCSSCVDVDIQQKSGFGHLRLHCFTAGFLANRCHGRCWGCCNDSFPSC